MGGSVLRNGKNRESLIPKDLEPLAVSKVPQRFEVKEVQFVEHRALAKKSQVPIYGMAK
jgi:hypothetical protein